MERTKIQFRFGLSRIKDELVGKKLVDIIVHEGEYSSVEGSDELVLQFEDGAELEICYFTNQNVIDVQDD